MTKSEPNALKRAMRAASGSLIATAFFSFFINLLMLSGPLYMLQVYDRVLTSNSIDTLIALSVMLLGLFVVTGCLEFVRARILSRIGAQLEARSAGAVLEAGVRKRVNETRDDGSQGISDLTTVRDFLSSNALPAFFDLPWVPIYLLILAILHPVMGLLGLGGALFLVALAWMNNFSTRHPMASYAQTAAHARAVASATEANAEVVQAMGMTADLRRNWLAIQDSADVHKTRGTDRSGLFAIISKTSRLLLQSAALGVGAALVIAGEFTAGAMIAGTIILGRGLAPVDQSIAHWRSLGSARAALTRLNQLLDTYPEAQRKFTLPSPRKNITVERVFAGPPGARKAIVSDINFAMTSGDTLAIIGPSASGKSTLARLLSGVWNPQAGDIRLDGVTFDQWNLEQIGANVGYLPQDAELFEGTIAQNIARFRADATDMEVAAAAEAAGVHDMIVEMPDGYETNVGRGGRTLSGGQRQRIGLARALFRDPFLTVLDEPNANLDADGDLALITAIAGIKSRGGIIVIVSHRPGIVDTVDKVLVLDQGRQRAFGSKDDVLAHATLNATNSNVTPLIKRAI